MNDDGVTSHLVIASGNVITYNLTGSTFRYIGTISPWRLPFPFCSNNHNSFVQTITLFNNLPVVPRLPHVKGRWIIFSCQWLIKQMSGIGSLVEDYLYISNTNNEIH